MGGDRLADDQTVGDQLADGGARVGVGDLVDLVGVEPDLALAAAGDGARQALLGAEVDPAKESRISTLCPPMCAICACGVRWVVGGVFCGGMGLEVRIVRLCGMLQHSWRAFRACGAIVFGGFQSNWAVLTSCLLVSAGMGFRWSSVTELVVGHERPLKHFR